MFFIIELMIAVFIIRFYGELNRLHFNPLMRKLIDITDPIIKPIGELIKKANIRTPFNPSALVAGFIISIIAGIIITSSLIRGIFVGAFSIFANAWLDVLIYSIFLVVIASWLQAMQSPVVQIARVCHEWLMAPLRKIIPPLGMLDFTPIAALFILYFIRGAVLPALAKLTLF